MDKIIIPIEIQISLNLSVNPLTGEVDTTSIPGNQAASPIKEVHVVHQTAPATPPEDPAKNHCVDCGKEIYPTSKRCKSCQGKYAGRFSLMNKPGHQPTNLDPLPHTTPLPRQGEISRCSRCHKQKPMFVVGERLCRACYDKLRYDRLRTPCVDCGKPSSPGSERCLKCAAKKRWAEGEGSGFQGKKKELVETPVPSVTIRTEDLMVPKKDYGEFADFSSSWIERETSFCQNCGKRFRNSYLRQVSTNRGLLLLCNNCRTFSGLVNEIR